MAYLRIEYFSGALRRQTSFEMYLPNDPRPESDQSWLNQPMKTLFLLHGYTGKAGNWVPEWVAEKYNLAIVMPSAENSFYLDGLSTGHAYQTMVGVELVDYVRRTFHLAMKPEDTFICGLSMGGFGALHTGLAYPETFGKIGALSSAFIVHEIAAMQPGGGNAVANYDYYRECFGDPATVLERDVNPEVLMLRLQAEGKALPAICMCCGTEDFLLQNNRDMDKFMTEHHIPHTYWEGPGTHDMAFWSENVVKVLDWMMN